jgi:hypothetical protein
MPRSDSEPAVYSSLMVAFSPPRPAPNIDLIDAAANARPFSFRKPCAASSAETLALTGTAQLGDRHGLVKLADRAKHLAHQLGRGACRPSRPPAALLAI